MVNENRKVQILSMLEMKTRHKPRRNRTWGGKAQEVKNEE